MNNLKKVISTAAAVAMLASSASAFAASFPDVDKSANYAGAVDTLTALNIVNGDDAGKFNPDNTVTRAEFAKMVVEAIGEGNTAKATTTTKFTDSTSHWAAGYIQTGVDNGFINGMDDTTFAPDSTVTYAQAVKMLVAAIGYTQYSELKGGWPGGYLYYGNDLKITDKVTGVSNDTAITRAQCAMLINNALKAPLCVQDGGEYTSDGKFVPKYEKKDTPGKDYKTLLTEKHDAYYVKGRVTGTYTTGGASEKDEVQFNVEASDNFDDVAYTGKTSTTTSGTVTDTTEVAVKINGTNAENMLFEYAEGIIQKDEDTDEYAFVSLEQYGANKTVTFKADDTDETDTNLANGKLAVKTSANSSTTKKYDLATDTAGNITAKMYVNGKKLDDGITTATIAKYLVKNATGDVTLIDETKTGSTSTDGKYDYIVVDYTKPAMVSSVEAKEERIRVNLKNTHSDLGTANRIEYNPTDDNDKSVKFFDAEGKEIAYTDLKEDDVLSIAWDVNGSFADSTYYNVYASNNVVSGTVTSKDAEENEIVVNGETYKIARGTTADYEFNTDYTLYLDKYGYVANYEEGESAKNFGIIASSFKKAGDTNYTVRLITADGSIKDYELHTDAVSVVKTMFGVEDLKDITVDGMLTDGAIDVAKVEKRTINYTLSGGKLKIKNNTNLTATSKGSIEFRASSSKLGNAELAEGTSKIVDIYGYIKDGDASAATVAVSSFTDETNYSALTFDRNDDGVARFVVVAGGLSNTNVDSLMAVVASNPSATQIDGDDYWTATVYRGGVKETITVNESVDSTSVKRGDVIAYAMKGTEATDIKIVKAAAPVYKTFAEAMTATTVTSLNTAAAIDASWATGKDGRITFGIIAKTTTKGMDLVTTLASGKADLDDAETFTINADTKITYYDYSYQDKNDTRVSEGTSLPSVDKSKWDSYDVKDSSGVKTGVIDWNAAVADGAEPSFALVKEVDGDVTEVIIFVK